MPVTLRPVERILLRIADEHLLATIIGAQFFSAYPPATRDIFALLAFAAGFLVRPFGAIVFGRVGDIVGRKYTFLVTILIMGSSTFLVGVAVVSTPRAWAGDAPIGHLGDTLRVDTGTYVADVTVSSVAPCDPPPGFGYTREGVPVKSFPGSTVDRADVTIRAVRVPDCFAPAK